MEPTDQVTLDGGSGNDEIGIFAISGSETSQSLRASGGAGADRITIESRYTPDDLDASDKFHAVGVGVDGGGGNDVIVVTVDAAYERGTGIDGGAGNDTITAEGGIKDIFGRAGNDTITVVADIENPDFRNTSTNYVDGGKGNDLIDLQAAGWDATNTVYGDGGDDEMTLAVGGYYVSNWADGGAGDDTIDLRAQSSGSYVSSDGASGSNEGHGGDGDDVLSAAIALTSIVAPDTSSALPESGLNLLYGEAGDDTLTASITVDDASEGELRSELSGGAGDDRLTVSGGDGNLLNGNLDNDTLTGGDGSDRLIGGRGDDYLRGNGGSDIFDFQSVRAREVDRIADFIIGEDVIDVSGIDANVFRGGDQAFTFDRSGDGGTGRLWVDDNPNSQGSLLHADTGRAILTVALLDGRAVDASDYSASDFLL